MKGARDFDLNAPGVEFDLFKLPFRTTPFPILREIVVIRTWPLCTLFLSICWTFLDFDVSLSIEDDRFTRRPPFRFFSEDARGGGVSVSGVAGEMVMGIAWRVS